MKINWGTGIVLAFVAFILFIMYFVVSMSVDKKYEHDMVAEDYYEEELKHQDKIDKLNNARAQSYGLSWKKNATGLTIVFPENLDMSRITGIVSLYRPSDESLDFELPLMLKENLMLIPKRRLLEGRWNIEVEWSDGINEYLYKQQIFY